MQIKTNTIVFIIICLAIANSAFAQSKFSTSEISINGFRAPSVGGEYRYKQVSVHAGYYPTAFKAGENTSFVKTGITVWFLPVGVKENPSSFYAGASYLRGLSRNYKGKNALGTEVGYRWMIWRGLNLRLGAITVAAKGQSLKLNPASGISYSFFIR